MEIQQILPNILRDFLNCLLCYLGIQKFLILGYPYTNPLIFVGQSNFPKDPDKNVELAHT